MQHPPKELVNSILTSFTPEMVQHMALCAARAALNVGYLGGVCKIESYSSLDGVPDTAGAVVCIVMNEITFGHVKAALAQHGILSGDL